ncbi:MAG TPA: hypothetical protein PL002_13745, partial [Flavobacteriales bacterium]|nr:hypothetical protein [Flavobacteriales bacterium]
RQVVKAFNEGSVEIVEAGTGTGKSLAYLIPAMLWAIQNGQRVVVSTNTINLPSNCDYITGVRIYCYSWSVLSYVHNNSYYCGAQDPYTPPCYAGRYTNNYKCPPDGVSGTTGCDSGSYCIYYQHCNDDNWDGSTGHCMNNGALRIIDLGQNFCPGGGSPRCEFP